MHLRMSGTACGAVAAMLMVLAIVGSAGAARAVVCDPYGRDADALEKARQAVAAACDCRKADDRDVWRRCVIGVLRGLRRSDDLSSACFSDALRFETDSVCGRPGAVVCCEEVNTGIRAFTRARIVSSGTCSAGYGSRLVHRAEACAARPPDRLVAPERCGNGKRDRGEECDPPDGLTCSAWCARCEAVAGTTRLACSDTSYGGQAVAAVPGSFLANFDTDTRTGARAFAMRLDGRAMPQGERIALSNASRGAHHPISSTADNAAADESGFYVSWLDHDAFGGHWRGRRISAAGDVAAKLDELESFGFLGFGMCGRSYLRGPLQLATTLDGGGVHWTLVTGQRCGFEHIRGVPFIPPRSDDYVSHTFGRGRLARGAHDVAALWGQSELLWPPTDVPMGTAMLYGGWIEPMAEPAAFPLVPGVFLSGNSDVTGLAAVGDTFLAAYQGPNALMGLRFSRAQGVLDAAPGLALARFDVAPDDMLATSDGEHFVVAWRERHSDGTSSVRLVRVATDGTVLDAKPVDVVKRPGLAGFGIAADADSIVVVFSELSASEPSVTTVRAVAVNN